MTQRFLTLTDVAETLNVTMAQAKALVRSGDLRAIKVGGRGAWRVENVELEAYITRMYAQTRETIQRDGSGPAAAEPARAVDESVEGPAGQQ